MADDGYANIGHGESANPREENVMVVCQQMTIESIGAFWQFIDKGGKNAI